MTRPTPSSPSSPACTRPIPHPHRHPGERALQLAASTPVPDLILLDVTMPDMDGYEVCRQLMNNPVTASIPVIFLTIRNEELDEQLGFDAGAIDYITKPISPPLVLTRIRNHLTLKAASDFLRDRNAYLEQEVGAAPVSWLIQDATIVAMASLAETRDNETGNHIRRTQLYLRTLARHLQHTRASPPSSPTRTST
jgi:putative two-component system response regulator